MQKDEPIQALFLVFPPVFHQGGAPLSSSRQRCVSGEKRGAFPFFLNFRDAPDDDERRYRIDRFFLLLSTPAGSKSSFPMFPLFFFPILVRRRKSFFEWQYDSLAPFFPSAFFRAFG